MTAAQTAILEDFDRVVAACVVLHPDHELEERAIAELLVRHGVKPLLLALLRDRVAHLGRAT
jgi:hypothetical protein